MKIVALMLALALTSCARIDTNGYYAKGGGTGSITCKGACP